MTEDADNPLFNPLGANWDAVVRVTSIIFDAPLSLDSLPGLLADILENDRWRHYAHPGGAIDVRHERFADFVTEHPPRGLGTSVEQLRALLGAIAEPALAPITGNVPPRDPKKKRLDVLDMLDRATQNRDGRPIGKETLYNIQGSKAPTGTSKTAALRRLRKARPDLHGKVLAGKLSPHAAMVEAGFRRKTVTVPIDDAGQLAAVLRRRLDTKTFLALARALRRELDEV